MWGIDANTQLRGSGDHSCYRLQDGMWDLGERATELTELLQARNIHALNTFMDWKDMAEGDAPCSYTWAGMHFGGTASVRSTVSASMHDVGDVWAPLAKSRLRARLSPRITLDLV